MKAAIFGILCLASLCSAFDYTGYYINLTPETRDMILVKINECYKISQITETDFLNAILCQDMSDKRMQQYNYCYLTKLGFINENNEFDVPSVRDILSDHNYNTADRCQYVIRKGQKIYAEEASTFIECYVRHALPAFCKAKTLASVLPKW